MGFSFTSNSSHTDACRDVPLGELGGRVPSALRRGSVSTGVRAVTREVQTNHRFSNGDALAEAAHAAGGVTVPGGDPETLRCGQGAQWGWADVGLGSPRGPFQPL